MPDTNDDAWDGAGALILLIVGSAFLIILPYVMRLFVFEE